MGKQLPDRSQQEGEDVPHQHVEPLCGERYGCRDCNAWAEGYPRRASGGNAGGLRICPGGYPQAAAVGQVGTNSLGVKSDVAEEVSVNEEDLLGLVRFQSKESIQDVCVGAEVSGE